jgi:hypothetical protein
VRRDQLNAGEVAGDLSGTWPALLLQVQAWCKRRAVALASGR